jgi:hypothetical protein
MSEMRRHGRVTIAVDTYLEDREPWGGRRGLGQRLPYPRRSSERRIRPSWMKREPVDLGTAHGGLGLPGSESSMTVVERNVGDGNSTFGCYSKRCHCR